MRAVFAAPLLLALVAASGVSAQAVAASQTTVQPRPALPGGGPQTQRPPRDAGEAPAGTARIKGRVVAADTAAPLRRAQLWLNAPEIREGRMAVTDAEGRFEFTELPAGRYQLSASKGGYVMLAYGQRRPFEQGRPIELREGQALENVDFVLPRGSVITGRILDEYGEPVAETMVHAMRYRWMGGRRRLMPVGSFGQSNDIGQFRLFGLPPGDYYVTATVRGMGMGFGAASPGGTSAATGYAPTFYPGTVTMADASPVTVGLGEEAAGIDFALLPVRTARITGTVVDSGGRPVAGATIMMIQRTGGAMIGGGGATTGRDGSFRLANVAPGDYALQVRSRPGPAGPGVFIAGEDGPGTEFASLDLTVTGDEVEGLILVTSPGGRLTGRVVDEQGVPLSAGQADSIRITMPSPDDSGMAFAGFGPPRAIGDEGAFELTGLFGRRLVRPVNLPAGWSLLAVRHRGADVSDTPLDFRGGEEVDGVDVVLTRRAAEVSGAVTDERGRPVSDYTAVVFAEDPGRWGYMSRFVSAARPSQDGRFRVTGLPEGVYLAAAVEYVQAGDWADPDLLESLRPHAVRFTLGPGDTRALDLTLQQ